LRDIVDDLFHRRIRIEEDVWMIVRTLAKYGSAYGEIVVTDKGVVGINYLPSPTMRRLVNNKGDTLGFVQDLTGQFGVEVASENDLAHLREKFKEYNMIFFEPWEIVHWRLKSKFLHSLYGWSFLDPARYPWKRLVLLEDSVLLHQLTKAPGRFGFSIDTGDLPPEEAMAVVRKARRQHRKHTLINPSTGKLEFRNNVLSPADDWWIPTRGGKEGTRIETVAGAEWDAEFMMNFLKDKLHTALTIPRSYYGQEADAERGMAQKDVRFARTCMRIQREFKNGCRQIGRVHLAALGIDPDVIEWSVRMTIPSSIFELQQIEVMNAQAGLVDTLSAHYPKEWLLQRVLRISQDEATEIVNNKAAEQEREMNDAARIAATIQNKYPDIDMGAVSATVGGDPGNPMESAGLSHKVDLLYDVVKRNLQSNDRTIKLIEEMEPRLSRSIKRLSKKAERGKR
jgi:hypothetical protein